MEEKKINPEKLKAIKFLSNVTYGAFSEYDHIDLLKIRQLDKIKKTLKSVLNKNK